MLPAKMSADINSTQIKNKIPEYASHFKKEWLCIRGINKDLRCFYIKYLSDASKLFVSSYSDRIKRFMRRFLKAQERGQLKDISGFIFEECDVKFIVLLFKKIHFYFYREKEFNEDEIVDYDDYYYYVNPPGYTDFYELFCKFYSKINVGFLESDSDSDSDSDY